MIRQDPLSAFGPLPYILETLQFSGVTTTRSEGPVDKGQWVLLLKVLNSALLYREPGMGYAEPPRHLGVVLNTIRVTTGIVVESVSHSDWDTVHVPRQGSLLAFGGWTSGTFLLLIFPLLLIPGPTPLLLLFQYRPSIYYYYYQKGLGDEDDRSIVEVWVRSFPPINRVLRPPSEVSRKSSPSFET